MECLRVVGYYRDHSRFLAVGCERPPVLHSLIVPDAGKGDCSGQHLNADSTNSGGDESDVTGCWYISRLFSNNYLYGN